MCLQSKFAIHQSLFFHSTCPVYSLYSLCLSLSAFSLGLNAISMERMDGIPPPPSSLGGHRYSYSGPNSKYGKRRQSITGTGGLCSLSLILSLNDGQKCLPHEFASLCSLSLISPLHFFLFCAWRHSNKSK